MSTGFFNFAVYSPVTFPCAGLVGVGLDLHWAVVQAIKNENRAKIYIMGNKGFKEEAYRLIDRIADRTERISGYQGRVPRIEIDLAMEDIRRLYDCMLFLRGAFNGEDSGQADRASVVEMGDDISTNDTVDAEKSGVVSAEDIGEVADTTGLAEVSVDDSDEQDALSPDSSDGEQPEESAREKDAPVVEKSERRPAVSDEEVASDSDAVAGESEVGTDDTEDASSLQTILGEKLRGRDKQSIHDLIASRRSDRSISTRIQHHPISNLKNAIGLNEKFIFVYELFGGNTQEYSAAIDRLNSMPGRDEAIGLMESMREQYHWDIDNMAFQKLVDMVARRYS